MQVHEPAVQSARVLLVEDDPSFAALVQAYLRMLAVNASASPVTTTAHYSGMPQLDTAQTLGEAVQHLGERPYDLVIADLNLPDSQGLATIDALKGAGARLILVITGEDDLKTAQAALERGAYDFLAKADMNPDRVKRLVRLAAIQASTVGSLRQSEAGARALLDEQVAHVRYQEKVARFGHYALSTRDASAVALEAAQVILEGLQADAVAYVERSADDQLVVRAILGLAETAGAMVAPLEQGSVVARTLAGDEALTVESQPALLPFAWAQAPFFAVLAPVAGEKGTRGLLCALHGKRPFGAPETKFVDVVASVLSAALRRIDQEARLSYLAQFDELTGLPNRALLADRFSQMIVQARRRGVVLGVLLVDLDEFKTVNDSLGHSAGDELLAETARRLQACVRAGDTVARISGDEYAIIVADLAKPEEAAAVAQKAIERVGMRIDLRGQEVFVTASVGIASFPADGDNADSLLGAASAAMYRAKETGRNNYQFFTTELNRRTRARAQLGSELHRALERNEFVLYYQPKFDLRTRSAIAAEALLRWRHPQRGMVSPAEFIPYLEETGLIVQVGEWVLRQACADIAAWLADGLQAVPVAVNLSARQFREANLDERVLATIRASGVSPHLIELEITESHLMHDPTQAVQILRALHHAGVRIAIDDFGTGYSSLAYLTRFPVSALKIDRSFIAGALSDTAAAAIVRTIVEMAHTLGFIVVAEGVETEQQVTLLQGLGCEQAQGYYLARPLPVADTTKLLKRSAR